MRNLVSLYHWSLSATYFGGLLLTILVRSYFQAPQKFDAWIKHRILLLFRILGVQLKIEYNDPLPEGQALIFMANHSSLIDIPLLQAGIPRPFIGILASHQFEFFLYGRVLRQLGHISIDRDKPRQSIKAFQQAKNTIAAGTSIVVLPEGGRSMDGRLIPFKKLPFRFAQESGAAIVPVGVSGAYAMKNKNSWRLTPGPLTLRFGSVIAAEELVATATGDLRDRVYADILDLLEPFEAGQE